MQDQNDSGHAPVLMPVPLFPGRPDTDAEEAALALRETSGADKAVHSACAGRDPWILHSGPPYANGDIHLGTALNTLLKDMAVRTMRMAGRDAVLVPGWDCHGLPVEWKVEEAFLAQGRRRADVPILEFRAACRAHAAHWAARQAGSLKRLGVLADWDGAYSTMSREADAAMVAEVQRLLAGGYLYRALRPVLWSVPEGTALADAEVEYVDARCHNLVVRFPVACAEHPELRGASLLCWTTTPWSLPGNRAVACNPDASYCVWEVDGDLSDGCSLRVGERVVLSSARGREELELAGAGASRVVLELPGRSLAGTVCRHPLSGSGFRHAVPVLAASFADADSGTGLVHVAPSLGPDDFSLAAREGMEVVEVLRADGTYASNVPCFAGMAVQLQDGSWGPAGRAVTDALASAGMLVRQWSSPHRASVSWRSKAPLVHRATVQWFVRMDGLRDMALSELAAVRFTPPGSRNRLESMLSGRPDWCVSRQRLWGVPLGLFTNRVTGEPLLDPNVLARVRQAFSEDGGDAWYTRPAAWFLGAGHDEREWEMCADVADVWLESGTTHAWVLRARHGESSVADLCLEGSDQHRGWFQSSLLESVATRGAAPYRALLTHGFVLDARGRKMSKSLGNVVDPLDLTRRHGADSLRLWVALSDHVSDVRWSPEAMKQADTVLFRLRNTMRWAAGNLASAPSDDLPHASLPHLERCVLARLSIVGRELDGLGESLDFAGAVRTLDALCADLSQVFFDASKDVLYCDPPASPARRAAVTALREVLRRVALWSAPYAPLAAAEAWEAAGLAGDVHAGLRPEPEPVWEADPAASAWELVRSVRREGRTLADNLPGGAGGAELTLALPAGELGSLGGWDLAALCGVPSLVVRASGAGPRTWSCSTATGARCPRCRRTLPGAGPRGCRRCEAAGAAD